MIVVVMVLSGYLLGFLSMIAGGLEENPLLLGAGITMFACCLVAHIEIAAAARELRRSEEE